MKTINQTYQAEFQAKKRKKLILFLLGGLLALGGVFYGLFSFLFLFDFFAVREINIEQKSFVKNEEIQTVINNYLGEEKWLVKKWQNIFLVKSGAIRKLLAQNFPVLRDVKVNKKYFHGLIISANLREPIGIWCFKKTDTCFYYDYEGVAFEKAADSAGSLSWIIEDQTSPNLTTSDVEKLGDRVAEPDRLAWLEELRRGADDLRLGITKIIIPEELFRINAKTTEGWTIYFSTKDDLSTQLKTLRLFLANKISPEQRNQLQYIDLSILNRVYYK